MKVDETTGFLYTSCDFPSNFISQKQFGATDTFLSRDPDTNICQEFYDCAPSGKNGTMTYISSSIATCLSDLLPPVVNQCLVS